VRLSVLALPGDGIGPEVTREGLRALQRVCDRFNHELEVTEGLIGGAAIREAGVSLPEATLASALASGAILLGAVGLPELDRLPPAKRPERGLLDLRRALGLFANIRPVRSFDSLLDASPLKNDVVRGADFVVVRELTGGLYYGTPRGISGEGAETRGFNTMTYSRAEIERIARVAFDIARSRRRKVTSVDKANVLETSQLWRQVVTEVAASYPDVELDHLFVDNCAMQLVLAPGRFDVILTENLFGDILSDEAAVLGGSIGLLPSASFGERVGGARRGLFEPVHGSAPDLAGRNCANPLGAIGSVAAMLDYGFGLHEEALAVTRAIERTIDRGILTADLARGSAAVGTDEVGRAVAAAIAETAPRK
jgi:3-isopropylmalate dehydrogenase